MTRIESELHDLYECLMRNDDMADCDTYHTIVGIANDAADVEAENAKLKRAAERDADVLESLNQSLEDSQAENAKLRELCEDMNKVAHMFCEAWEGSCSKEAEGMSLHAVCPIGDTSELCVFGKLHDRIRELGIEVKE